MSERFRGECFTVSTHDSFPAFVKLNVVPLHLKLIVEQSSRVDARPWARDPARAR